MDITLYPRKLNGTLSIIPSKSQAHRLLICSAFADQPTELICPAANKDIEATISCLDALGAHILPTKQGYQVVPVSAIPEEAVLDCGESGSTLRFMLPIAAALGVKATFVMSGRLPSRPLSPLWEELERMGCHLSRPTENTIHCAGKLQHGIFSINGSVSSQFITGLMFALALLPEKSELKIIGKTESKPYIQMTEQALALFGVTSTGYRFGCSYPFHSPGTLTVEGDWSNGAFFCCANALGNNITIHGLNEHSAQGDKAVGDILTKLNQCITVSGEDIPDLIPVLAVTAGAKQGATFQNIGRLRLKESDRIASTAAMLKAMGIKVNACQNSMQVFPGEYCECIIDSQNDHRIAMAAAVASTVATGPVTILGAECVSKSYPTFWEEFTRLGGYYEQYIR